MNGKFHELCSSCLKYQINIIAIQEHRHRTELPIDRRWSDDGNYLFIFSSADKNGVGGVGFLVCKRYANYAESIQSISNRIMLINFESNPALSIICTHAPTNNNHNIKNGTIMIDNYYNEIDTIKLIPKHNFLVIAGDFNARIG